MIIHDYHALSFKVIETSRKVKSSFLNGKCLKSQGETSIAIKVLNNMLINYVKYFAVLFYVCKPPHTVTALYAFPWQICGAASFTRCTS